MKVLIFGATGMVGQGVLRQCLAAEDVSLVTVVGRTPVVQNHAKLQQCLQGDLLTLGEQADQLRGFDACFFCLGVSSSGMSEEAYRQITYDLTLSVARLLAQLNPSLVFTYVSGAGADSTEHGRSMWARVKGKTENDLKKLPFSGVYLFRPGLIQPLHGIRSKTKMYQRFYSLAYPLLSLIRRVCPRLLVSTEDMGNAMLNAARARTGRVTVEARDIVRLARGPA